MGGAFYYFKGDVYLDKVAIIVDGQFLLHRLKDALGETEFTDHLTIHKYTTNLTSDHESIYRIFFYQGEPSKQKSRKPLSEEEVDFKDNSTSIYYTKLLKSLSMMELFAVRRGETQFRGWKLKKKIESQ